MLWNLESGWILRPLKCQQKDDRGCDNVGCAEYDAQKIFGPAVEEARGAWRKVHNQKLHDAYSFQNIFHVLKQRKSEGRGMWHLQEK